MATCVLIDMNNQGECIVSDGGIFESYIASSEDITDVIFDTNGVVTNFVMATTGKWKHFEYDDDDSAYYNQTGERSNKKHTQDQQAFIKFAGVSQARIDASQQLADCCSLVAVHIMNNGKKIVQGVDWKGDWTPLTWLYTKAKLKATVNVLTDTPENEDRVEITLISKGRRLSRLTSLGGADLLLL